MKKKISLFKHYFQGASIFFQLITAIILGQALDSAFGLKKSPITIFLLIFVIIYSLYRLVIKNVKKNNKN